MNGTTRTIAKNASALMASQAITWSLGLVWIVLAARFLGPTAVGKFHLALSIWAMLGVLVTFGLDILLTKEIARSRSEMGVLLGTALGLRGVFFVLSLGVLAVYLSWASYPPETVLVLYLWGVSAFIGMLGGVVHAALQGLERMEYCALGTIANRLVFTLLAVVVLLFGQGVVAIALVVIVAACTELLIILLALKRVSSVRLGCDWERARWLLSAGVPYFLGAVFLAFYWGMDVVILSLLVNEEVVGWFSAADRLFSALLFIPVIVMQAVFPALSRKHLDAPETLRPFLSLTLRVLLLLGVPIGIGLIVISDSLVVLMYGSAFVKSGAVLAVFGLVSIFMYVNILLGRTMYALDRQMTWTKLMAVATAATVPLGLLLIPWCHSHLGNGAIGGAATFVITESVMMAIGLYLLPRGLLQWSDAVETSRILLAGILMGLVVWWWRDSFIAVPVVVGVVAYVSLVALLRAVPQEMWDMARVLGLSLVQRARVRFSRAAAARP